MRACECVCVRVRARVRACMHVHAHECNAYVIKYDYICVVRVYVYTMSCYQKLRYVLTAQLESFKWSGSFICIYVHFKPSIYFSFISEDIHSK